LVRLSYVPNGVSKAVLVSDSAWKASKEGPAGWEKGDFDDGKWSAVKVIGPYGEAGPWENLGLDSGGGERFRVPAGFKVEKVANNPTPGDPFSLINLTFDDRGRLLLSKENGGILLCTDPDKNGVFQKVRPYCEQVKNCQGMCWVKDALLLV